MEVRSSSGSRRWGRVCRREAPGTAGDGPFQAPAFMVPVALADVAVVRMEIPGEQLLASRTHRAIPGADERKAPQLRIVGRDFTGGGCGARVLPAVTLTASMRMTGVLLAHQLFARRRPSSAASLPGPSCNAR